MLRLNLAACNESHAKFGCIYNAEGAGGTAERDLFREAGPSGPISRGKIRSAGNVITGFKMAERCIAAAPGVDLKSNTIKENMCRNQ